jgi:hypothetical protein
MGEGISFLPLFVNRKNQGFSEMEVRVGIEPTSQPYKSRASPAMLTDQLAEDKGIEPSTFQSRPSFQGWFASVALSSNGG